MTDDHNSKVTPPKTSSEVPPRTIMVEVDGELIEAPNPAYEAYEAERLAHEEEAANALVEAEAAARRAAEAEAAAANAAFEEEYARLEAQEAMEQERLAREAEIEAARLEANRVLREQEAEEARLEVLRDTFLVVLGIIQPEGGAGEVGFHPEDAPVIAKQVAFLMAYADCGVVKTAADIARVPRSTHQIWLKDPRYQEAFALAQEMAGDILEQEAIRRAAKGVEEPVFYRGEVVGSVRKFSDALLTFLLKGNRPEKFRERFDISNPQDEMRKLATLLGVTPNEVAAMLKSGDIPANLTKLGDEEKAPTRTGPSGKTSIH